MYLSIPNFNSLEIRINLMINVQRNQSILRDVSCATSCGSVIAWKRVNFWLFIYPCFPSCLMEQPRIVEFLLELRPRIVLSSTVLYVSTEKKKGHGASEQRGGCKLTVSDAKYLSLEKWTNRFSCNTTTEYFTKDPRI